MEMVNEKQWILKRVSSYRASEMDWIVYKLTIHNADFQQIGVEIQMTQCFCLIRFYLSLKQYFVFIQF